MSGPMQWTQGLLVPANGTIPNPDIVKGGAVDMSVAHSPPAVRTAAPKTKALSPKNVVAMAKARLRDVKAELRKLKALEKEKGELERLIAAAEGKPSRSNVRELKRTVG